MKKRVMHLLIGAIFGATWTVQVHAQDDPVVTIEPQAEAEAADSATSSLTGGFIVDNSGQHVDVSRVRGFGHALRDHHHPYRFYAHSRRGAEATWTHQWNQQQAMMRAWHGNYYHRQYGAPLALVVPPTAAFQTNWSWGVGRTTSTPIYHQFARPYPGPASGGSTGFYRTPAWPSHTSQFGVYYVRSPW